MTRIPKQFYILGLALVLFSLPLSYLFSDENQRYVLPVYITFQLAFVMLCNKITQAAWATVVIIIEAVCMMWNALLFLFWNDASSVFYDAYEAVMIFAFALEILVVNLSMIGGQNGRNRKNTPFTASNLLRCGYSRGNTIIGKEVAK